MTTLYTLTPLTNLHVGSGDINFDIIDNQVQKDATTKLAVIHSSSLKGALREHFSSKLDEKLLNYIFGSEERESGNYSFFEAKLLTRPVRSNVELYFHATTPSVIQEFLNFCTTLGIELDAKLQRALNSLAKASVKEKQPWAFTEKKGVIVEDFQAISKKPSFDESLHTFLGKNIVLFNDKDFKKLDLPVIARNRLNNGTSENLWYEEVVPSQTKFYFSIVKNKEIEEFEKGLHEEIVQVGANKSIGYGFSKIQKVS